jgi:hypothetical protein
MLKKIRKTIRIKQFPLSEHRESRTKHLPTTDSHQRFTHHVYELRQLELDLDGEGVAYVDNGTHQLVVIAEQVVVQTLSVGVARAP